MAPLGIPLDHFFQRLLAAVVHVGSRVFDVADRRRFEGAEVLLVLRHRFAATVDVLVVRVHADAQVVVLFVGEIRADVAGRAIALGAEEDLAAALRAVRHRMLLGRLPYTQIFLIQLGIVGLSVRRCRRRQTAAAALHNRTARGQ